MAGHVAQPARDASGGPVGNLEDRHATHRVGALAVAHRLDVGVLVGVDRRRDRHALGEVGLPGTVPLAVAAVVGLRAHQRLGVGTGQRAEPAGDVREPPAVLHTVQQALRAVGAGRDDHAPGRERTALALLLVVGRQRADGEATAGVLGERDDGGHRVDDGSRPLGEVEVVLVEGVLGAVAAARHALTALGTRLAGGARATEVRVRDLFSGRRLRGFGSLLADGVPAVPEEDPDRRHVEGVADAHGLRGRLQMHIGRRHRGVEPYAQHPLGLVVVRLQLLLPVRDVLPLRVVEERLGRYVEGVGVVQRTAADPGTRQDHDIPQQVDALDAVEAEGGGPQIALEVPGVLRERLAGEAAAGFEDADAVALLGQPERGDRAAEAGADDEHVVVVPVVLGAVGVRGIDGVRGSVGVMGVPVAVPVLISGRVLLGHWLSLLRC